MSERKSSPASRPNRQHGNMRITRIGGILFAAGLVVGSIPACASDSSPKPLPSLECTYYKEESGISTYVTGFIEPLPGSTFDKEPLDRQRALVSGIDVTIGDAGPDGPTPVLHPHLYEDFGHMFVDASNINTHVDVRVHAKHGSGYQDGACDDDVSFEIEPGPLEPPYPGF